MNKFEMKLWKSVGKLLNQKPNVVLQYYQRSWSLQFKTLRRFHRIVAKRQIRKQFSNDVLMGDAIKRAMNDILEEKQQLQLS